MSLCYLLQRQGSEKKRRKLMTEIYDWFTEKFDAPDLKDARALLEELP